MKLFDKMSTETKPKDDSKLYLTIDSMVETLRSKGHDNEDIEQYILTKVRQIIREQ